MPKSFNFDNFLPHIGEFGRYQKCQFALLATIPGIYVGWAFGSTMFLIMPSDHWCKMPPNHTLPLHLQNMSNMELEQLLIPMKTDQTGVQKREKCLMKHPRNASFPDSDDNLIPCPFGWTFDPEGKWLLMNEFTLVCGQAYLLSLMMTVETIFGMIGMFFLVNITDVIGRKMVIYIMWPLHLILGLLTLFSPNFTAYFIITVLQSLVSRPMYLVPCVLAMELVGPKHHTLIINGIGIVFAIASGLYAVVAYLCHTWKQQILFYLVCFIPVQIAYFFLIDESPRWLLSKGKNERAMKIIEKIARINGRMVSRDQIELLLSANHELQEKQPNLHSETMHETEVEQPKTVTSILTLFTNKKLALITVSMCFLWSVMSLIYSALTYNIPNFGGSRYLIFAVMALIEIPGCLINFIIDKTGRIWPFGISLFVSGLVLLAASLTPAGLVGVVVLFVVIAKLCITAAWNIVLQIGGELFPTVLRTTGCGFASTTSRIVGSVSPFVAYSAAAFHALPTLIMSAMAFAGSVVVFFLPETMNHTLPETAEDAKRGPKVGLDSFLMNITCQCKKTKSRTNGVDDN